jgi:hypothetical protein
MPKTKRPVDPRQKNQQCDFLFDGCPVVSSFFQHVALNGTNERGGNEVLCVGSRGDGKTIGVLSAMTQHAVTHHEAGYPLPVNWMGVTDTFTSHKLKTVRSLEHPVFKNGWKLRDNDHVAEFYHGGTKTVHLDLFGIEDQGAMDRLRMESTCLWFEEPAPSAVMVQSNGISVEAWMLGITSCRMPSHFNVKVATENYPDEDHWTWERWKPGSNIVYTNPLKILAMFRELDMPLPAGFYKERVVAGGAGIAFDPQELRYPEGTPPSLCCGVSDEGRVYFRVPVGERASEEDRLQWARALKERPDLLRRLILGQPGVVMLGDQVANGFTREDHTTKQIVPFVPGEPLFLGFDFGHTPTCVIGQPVKGLLRIKAGLWLKNNGMRQLMEELVRPYLAKYAPWVLRNPDDMALIGHDPSQGDIAEPKGGEADIENAALLVIQESLGGGWFEMGPTIWDVRKDALIKTFQPPGARRVVIEDNQYTQELIRALDGRWYLRKSHTGELRSDKPYKGNAPYHDLGDAFTYLLCRYGFANEIDRPANSGVVIRNIQPGM